MTHTSALIGTTGGDLERWEVLRSQADVLLKSGYLPQHVKTAEQAIAIVMTGQELGISPTRALAGITVISGKPTLSAELMAVLIFRDHGPDALVFRETTNERCTIAYRRRGASQGGEYTFSAADAKQAGLTSATWQKFPAAMLRARCISAVARFAFPDSIAGCYTPEELGAEVTVRGDSVEVVSIPQPAAPLQLAQTNGHAAEDAPAKPETILALQKKASQLALLSGEVVDVPEAMSVAQAKALRDELTAKRDEYTARQRQIEQEAAAASRVDTAQFAPLGDDDTMPF